VETAKRSKTFGRSCRVCRVYFLTSDPNMYTCPWCLKGEKGTSTPEVDYRSGNVIMDTQMLVQEEVQ
jgi:hypothetical protein